jgi:carbonic anhydrase
MALWISSCFIHHWGMCWGVCLCMRYSATSTCTRVLSWHALTSLMLVWMCAEGVQWILLKNPIFVFGDDYKALHALMGNNFRPVQPLNGRVVTTSV